MGTVRPLQTEFEAALFLLNSPVCLVAMYQKPASIRQTLERTAVEVDARKLFELMEKPWMSKERCSVICEPVEKLA